VRTTNETFCSIEGGQPRGSVTENLSLSGLTVTPQTLRSPVLQNICLNLAIGKVAILSGASGSGKTTLLKTINGLIPWIDSYHIDGSIHLEGEPIDDLDPGQRSHLIGTCLDRPENQLFLPCPRDEIEHATERYRTDPRIKDMLVEKLCIEPLLNRSSSELSSGERQRVALATTLMAEQRPILLDEPTAHLDSKSVKALTGAVTELARHGSSFLVAEHATWRWKNVATDYVKMTSSKLSSYREVGKRALPAPSHSPGEKVSLALEGLQVGRKGKAILKQIDLKLHQGEIIALSGSNGAGKSTLARTLAGWLKPIAGKVHTRDQRHPSLMLPEAELQLFARTVQEELAAHCISSADLSRILRRHRIEHLAARPPWMLSRGEQQRLVHAVHDLMQPNVLIIDEPAQGLGSSDLKTLVKLIHRRAQKGRAYLLITHRSDLAAIAHRHLRLEDGQLKEVKE